MPPKPKFEKREIVEAALEIAREKGVKAITAREVGARLGTSTRPVFTYFSSMDALVEAVTDEARNIYLQWLRAADDYVPSFKKRGMLLVQFAQSEPKLFQMLFMTEQAPDMEFGAWMRLHEAGFESDIQKICEDYDISQDRAESLFQQVWVYAHGICALCATQVCSFTEREVSAMLGKIFAGCILYIKSGDIVETDAMPVSADSVAATALKGAFPYKSSN